MAVATLVMRAERRGRPTITVPTAITLECYLPRPKYLVPKPRARTPQPPSTAFPAPCKPDADNLAKCLLDSLVQAGVIVDDCRCTWLLVTKWYVAVDGPDREPGVSVTVAGA